MTNYDRELLLKHGFDPNEKDDEERMRNLMTAHNREADYVNEEREQARRNAIAPFGGFATEQDQRNFIVAGLGGTAPYPKSQRQRDLESRFIPVREGNRRILDSATETRGQLETAGKELREKRSVQSPFNIFGDRRAMTLETNLIVPQYSSTTITPNFSMVSSLVEAVAHLSLDGGESFSQPYISDIETGGYTKESENYHGAETRFNYAQINRTKVTAYAELTEELEKLPAATYADTVFQNIRTSIQKVLSREILFGEGVSTTDNQSRLVGIFSDKATAIDPTTDLSLSAITDTTLNEILYRYGGDEEVESPSCLLLNKYDLLSFANVRTATKQQFYDIKFNGNGVSGTINGVNFIVNSNCKPLMSADTKSGDYCMAYGSLSNYLLAEFSPVEVKSSDDYKFRQGVKCFKGSFICGGNVVKQNGFIRVKKL